MVITAARPVCLDLDLDLNLDLESYVVSYGADYAMGPSRVGHWFGHDCFNTNCASGSQRTCDSWAQKMAQSFTKKKNKIEKEKIK